MIIIRRVLLMYLLDSNIVLHNAKLLRTVVRTFHNINDTIAGIYLLNYLRKNVRTYIP